MVVLSPIGDTGLLACSECKYAILPSRISTHFQGSPHQLSPEDRRKLAEDISSTSGIFRDSKDLEKLRIPSSFPYFYPELVLFTDGLGCQDCSYTIRTESAIIRHYREEHAWDNPRKKGGKQRKITHFPWKTDLSCQRFFPSGQKSSLFRVNPNRVFSKASPEEEGTPESSESESEDLDENRPQEILIRNQGPIDPDIEWARLDSNFEDFKKREIRKIQKNLLDDVSPWLERTRWAEYLSGLDRSILLGLIDGPDTPLLRRIWLDFDNLVEKSQKTLRIVGLFGRFELARTEKNQVRARPFRGYRDPGRISRYSRPWKQILSFFVRTQENPNPIDYPTYSFDNIQVIYYRRYIGLVYRALEFEDPEENLENLEKSTIFEDSSSDFHDEDEDEEEVEEDEDEAAKTIIRGPRYSRKVSRLSRIEKALLSFLLSLLDRKSDEDEYELPLVDALAVLGLEENGFRGPDSYPSILSSILKISKFFVLRFAFEPRLEYPSDLDSNSNISDLDLSREPVLLFSDLDLSEKPLERLTTLIDRFLIRGTKTTMAWLLDLRSYGLKIARNSTSPGYIDWSGETILYKDISFSLSNFRSFLFGLIESTRDILFTELLFSSVNNIPEIPWSRIFDNPVDNAGFSNFLANPRSDFGLENSDR
ncbi:hypothetical protein ACLMJK_002827 [Lecanora helva]